MEAVTVARAGGATRAPAISAAAAETHLLRLATGYMPAAALHVALLLDLPDRLATTPRPVMELADETATNEDALYRLLRALAAVAIFTETGPRTFAPTPLSAALRRTPDGRRDAWLWLTSPFNLRTFGELAATVRSGEPAVPALAGLPFFDMLGTVPALARLFDDAMVANSTRVIASLLAREPFRNVRVLVDVGGGRGHVLAAVLRRYPEMRGILADLPHVATGELLAADEALQGRWRVEAGSFFDAVPAGGDAYLLKQVLHDWDDAHARALLRNIRAALQDVGEGRLLVLESMATTTPMSSLGPFMDLSMLLLNGGRERTKDEFAALFDGAGFVMTDVIPLDAGFSLLIARPR